MSTREKVPWLYALLIVLGFAVTTLPAFLRDPIAPYVNPDAEAGMRRNSSGQVVCAHLNTSTGQDHLNSTSVNVFYHNNSSFVSLGTASHQNQSAGIYCYTLTADATNYDLVKVLWQGTGAITLLQTYPTVGWDESATIQDVNVTKVNGTTQVGGRVYADVTHINSTAQSGGMVAANVTHVSGTTQTGADLASLINTNTGHLTSTVYGLAALHTDNTNQTSGSTPVYALTDEGKRIASAVDVAAVGVHEEYLPQYHASSSVTVGDTTGQFSAGDITNLGLLNASTVTIGETGSGVGIDAQLLFSGMEAVDIPSEIHVWGYYAGSANHWVSVQAWNYRSGAWEFLHPNNSANGMPNASAVMSYRFPLHQQHFDSGNGTTLVRFLHQGGATGAHTGLVLDKVAADFVYTEAPPSAPTIAAEVWNTTAASHTAGSTMGGVLNDAPTLDEIDSRITEKHGSGPY